MSRPLRIEYENAYYHVMNRGGCFRPIFHGDEYFEIFLNTLHDAIERFGIEVHAYCLMDNHYHLLVKTPRGNLSRAMRHINGVYTQRHNRMQETDGVLFRGRYKAILVDSDSYFLHLSKYIHLNPLEANMVEALEDYKWSSYLSYIGNRKPPLWLSKEFIYDLLPLKTGKARAYKRFMSDLEINSEIKEFYAKKRLPPVMGGEQFIKEIPELERDNKQEVSSKEKNFLKPNLDSIVELVSEEMKVERDTILKVRKGRGAKNQARSVVMFIAQKTCDYKLTEIADYLGLSHYGSVSNSIFRLSEELEIDKKLQRTIKGIIKRLDP